MGILENEILRLRKAIGDVYSEDGQEITINNVNLRGEFSYEDYLNAWNKSARNLFSYVINNMKPKYYDEFIGGFRKAHFVDKDPNNDYYNLVGITVDTSGTEYYLTKITSVTYGSTIYRYLPLDEFKMLSSFKVGDFYTVDNNRIYLTGVYPPSIYVTYYKYEDSSPGYFSPIARDKIIELAIVELVKMRNINSPEFLSVNSGSLNSEGKNE